MEEILKGIVCDKKYDLELEKMVITRNYHIYIDEYKEIHLDAPITPKKLRHIRKVLKENNIEYNNLIIGHPEI